MKVAVSPTIRFPSAESPPPEPFPPSELAPFEFELLLSLELELRVSSAAASAACLCCSDQYSYAALEADIAASLALLYLLIKSSNWLITFPIAISSCSYVLINSSLFL